MKKYLSFLITIGAINMNGLNGAAPAAIVAKEAGHLLRIVSHAHPARIVFPSFPYKSLAHLEVATTALKELSVAYTFNTTAVSPYHKFSNTHEARANDFRDALESGASVVWSFAGGSGCTQILDYLKGYIPPAGPKPLLIGFSDMTSLLIWGLNNGYPVLHAPALGLTAECDPISRVGINAKTSIKEVTDIITGRVAELFYTFRVLYAPATSFEDVGSITGGNLTILKELSGTDVPLDTKGKFLFIENVYPTEPAYLTRELLALARAEALSGIKGIIFGNMGISRESEEEFIEYLRQDLLRHGITVPILQSDEFGHGEVNHPLPFGTEAHLSITGDKAELKIKVG